LPPRRQLRRKNTFAPVQYQYFTVFLPLKRQKMDAVKIGQIIRAHRKAGGLSREACARLAGVGKTAIFDIERGKDTVQLATLLKLLRALNISIRLESPLMKTLGYAEG
jgi:HTH-type transcriptional regulator / antitoxin HipB